MTTDLRELLSDAAQSDVRPDLAQRAISSARTRRRQRVVVGGAVLAAAAVVLGVVIGGGNLRTNAEPRPTDVASLPEQLPSAVGLPPLADGTMDAASAAYVVDDELVVIDAASGDGAVVDFDGGIDILGQPLPFVDSSSELALSPDGRTLAIGPGGPRGASGEEALLVLDVGSGVMAPQSRLSMAVGGARRPQMAWSPDGLRFACICTFLGGAPTIWIANPTVTGDDGQLSGWPGPDLAPSQISWGTDGLAAQFKELKADWRVVPTDGALPDPETFPPLESVSTIAPGVLPFPAVAMGHSDVGGFLAQMRDGDVWVVTATGERTVVGNLGVRPTLGALGDSYFVVFTDWKGDPLDSTVTRVDVEGESTLTTLPEGARTVSFASGLVD
jgi:hypothetical protein